MNKQIISFEAAQEILEQNGFELRRVSNGDASNYSGPTHFEYRQNGGEWEYSELTETAIGEILKM